MSGDRNLNLGPPVVVQDEPPPSAEELAAADELRALLERGNDEWSSALRAAYEPSGIDAHDNDSLIERALGIQTMDAPATLEEQRAAQRVREAIDHPRSDDRDAPEIEVLDALVAAHRPRSIDPLRNELLITRALKRSSKETRSRRVVPIVTAAVLGVAAMAAGVALYLKPLADKPVATNAPVPVLQRSRSAADLFDSATPFPRVGGESARVDRIASVRAAELRDNRFALWGVR